MKFFITATVPEVWPLTLKPLPPLEAIISFK